MDILISSNLERLIYRVVAGDAVKNKELMDALVTEGKYAITEQMKETLADFYGNYTTEAETLEKIAQVYRDTKYVIDTHTAVAAAVYDKYVKDTNDTTKTVIASTASPYKFLRSVMEAVAPQYNDLTDFELFDKLMEVSGVPVPQAIEDIRSAEVLHNTVVDVDQMKDAVKNILGI